MQKQTKFVVFLIQFRLNSAEILFEKNLKIWEALSIPDGVKPLPDTNSDLRAEFIIDK